MYFNVGAGNLKGNSGFQRHIYIISQHPWF